MVCRQTGTNDNDKSGRGGGMKTGFPTQIRSAAIALLKRPARVSSALGLAALAAACAPVPQQTGYQLYNVRPAVATPWQYQQQQPVYYYTPPDQTDPVITAPTPAPAPSENRQAYLSPVTPAEAAPVTPPQTVVPPAPPPDPSNRSPTCGYWRLGCGILWQ
jgi:hypothetical protein